MDIKIFTKMLKDKHFTDYQKMQYKYGEYFNAFLQTLEELYYKTLPLLDFDDNNIVFIENHAAVNQNAVKLLLQSQERHYGIKAAEDEIVATSAIESIDFSRDSVRKILKGMAPKDEQENRILGIKHGLEFIADTSNKITEENLYKLYMMTVGDFLTGDDKLLDGNYYRHDTVYVVSDRVEHSGLDYKKVPEFMKTLIAFVNAEDDINDLIKAAIIHFYIAFVHPYFDGNGRTARLVHLWFLIQKGYQSALFIPFSSQIEKSRKAYYDAYTTIEENKKLSGKIDVTPFVLYFINNVYNKMNEGSATVEILSVYDDAVKDGKITEKETKLWKFVLSFYGTEEFSTKQLEKDFGDAAYATIRGFVLKFEDLGLLSSVKYGPRVKYKIVKP
ncbi:MAG: Fic family protein [Ruminococcaceae bacterium]|nr:Fic family protein [Oscillospiraceae bacterium]